MGLGILPIHNENITLAIDERLNATRKPMLPLFLDQNQSNKGGKYLEMYNCLTSYTFQRLMNCA